MDEQTTAHGARLARTSASGPLWVGHEVIGRVTRYSHCNALQPICDSQMQLKEGPIFRLDKIVERPVPRRSRIVAEWPAGHQKCAGHQVLRARDDVFA